MNLNFAENIDRVLSELPEYASEIMKDNEKKITALIKGQLLSGLTGDGKRTKRYISQAYIKRARKSSVKSFPYRNYFINGNFQSEIFLETTGSSEVYLGSYHELNKYIEPQEENLFGITPENSDVVSGIIVKPLLKRVGNELTRN